MIVFNELRLSEDKKDLIVGCGIEDLSIYDGLYIDTVYLEYYKNMQSSGSPSEKAILLYDNEKSGINEQALRICFNESLIPEDFGTNKFEGGIFYIIIRCDGPSSALANLGTMSCGFDNTVDIGVVIDWQMLYAVGMQYIAKLSTSCDSDCPDSTGFSSFSILWNAIRLAAFTCDYNVLEKLWDKFMRISTKSGIRIASGCGCK